MTDDAQYAALVARDVRFDGVLYVGVTTTGVYCRPICPAKTPGRSRCRFFASAHAAEHAGFRACFRCRPELAPGTKDVASVDASSRLVQLALGRLGASEPTAATLAELAHELGVSDRHLRRVFMSELGVTPIALVQSRRLALAKQLLHDTSLSLAQVAFSAGFGSVRRFNAAFVERFGRAPSSLRRATTRDAELVLRLDYRPPLDWDLLCSFLKLRALPGIERIEDGVYWRSLTARDGTPAELRVQRDPTRHALRVSLSPALADDIGDIVARVRRLFDLDAQPDKIAAHFAADPILGPCVAARPGLRVPGAYEPFEMALRAILNQQVSVRAAITLAGRVVARFGAPTAEKLAVATSDELRALGLTQARAATLQTLSRALVERRVSFDCVDPEATMAALVALPGIGPWTANYVAMRGLAWPDAFPVGDLGIKKALGVTSDKAMLAHAEAWRPWRAYAVMHLWHRPTT